MIEIIESPDMVKEAVPAKLVGSGFIVCGNCNHSLGQAPMDYEYCPYCGRKLDPGYRFKEGQYIIYHNGSNYEVGRIKELTPTGAFVAYHSGETGAKTPYDKMHPIINAYCIQSTNLGGEFFK